MLLCVSILFMCQIRRYLEVYILLLVVCSTSLGRLENEVVGQRKLQASATI